jgi:hypothetical protein
MRAMIRMHNSTSATSPACTRGTPGLQTLAPTLVLALALALTLNLPLT